MRMDFFPPSWHWMNNQVFLVKSLPNEKTESSSHLLWIPVSPAVLHFPSLEMRSRHYPLFTLTPACAPAQAAWKQVLCCVLLLTILSPITQKDALRLTNFNFQLSLPLFKTRYWLPFFRQFLSHPSAEESQNADAFWMSSLTYGWLDFQTLNFKILFKWLGTKMRLPLQLQERVWMSMIDWSKHEVE